MVRETAERDYIVAVCRYSGFNVRQAAEAAGPLSRPTSLLPRQTVPDPA
jgi:hypothetical protein